MCVHACTCAMNRVLLLGCRMSAELSHFGVAPRSELWVPVGAVRKLVMVLLLEMLASTLTLS